MSLFTYCDNYINHINELNYANKKITEYQKKIYNLCFEFSAGFNITKKETQILKKYFNL